MTWRYDTLKKSDIFSHLTSLKYISRWIVLLIDLLLCTSAFLFTVLFLSQFEIDIVLVEQFSYGYRLLVILCVQLLSFWLFHTYSGVLRYSGFVDIMKVFLSIAMNALVLFIADAVAHYTHQAYIFSPLEILLYSLISFLLLFGLRFSVKTIWNYLNLYSGNMTRVMIYGTRSSGIAIAKMLRSLEDVSYKIEGFIDDKDLITNRFILGMKVFPKDEELIPLMRRMRVDKVIVSTLKMQDINPSTDLDIFINNNIKVLYAPSIMEWDNTMLTSQRVSLATHIKHISIEDLLERPSIQINLEPLKQQLSKAIVLVTGAAGSIGSELVRQVAQNQPHLIVLLDQAESPLHDLRLDLAAQFPDLNFATCIADVRDRERMKEIMNTFRPDIIYHAAAYKHVPLMEEHPCESIRANVLGTKNLADMAVLYGVKRFVMVSTDKAVNPTNIMGATKRVAEIYVQSLFKKTIQTDSECTKFITTRFGNVLGSNGSVIPYFKKQIEQGGPVTVTHPDIIRYFMTIPEACSLVCEAGLMGEGGEIFVFDMGHPVKILDLAKKMIRLSGYTPGIDIKIVFTGLRPGEKLYEELLNKKEITIPTTNSKIMVAKVREFPFDEVSKQVDELVELATAGKTYLAVSKMKEIVPEYISNNSPYEQLDLKNHKTK